jgi:hypothetical protein
MTVAFPEALAWIEAHPVTVGLIEAAVLVGAAWFTGVFAYFRRFVRRPKLRVARTASFVYLHEYPATAEEPAFTTAAFVINASVINRSIEKVVVDHFWLAYECSDRKRSFKQKLLKIGFPDRPRKRSGSSYKFMGVWFSKFPASELELESAEGILEPADIDSGYLLFVSKTYGTWSPTAVEGTVKIELSVELSSGDILKTRVTIRALRDSAFLDEFVPNLTEHVLHESVANHDLSVI